MLQKEVNNKIHFCQDLDFKRLAKMLFLYKSFLIKRNMKKEIEFILTNNETIREKVYLLTFETDKLIKHRAGQYITFEIKGQQRAYSILKTWENNENNYIQLLISTWPGGVASQEFEKIDIGQKLIGYGPMGRFVLKKNNLKKVFIATGTGIVPLLAMAKRVKEQKLDINLRFYFGIRNASEDYLSEMLKKLQVGYKNIKRQICCSKENKTLESPYRQGRVTDALRHDILDQDNECEYYICGNPKMVEEVEKILKIDKQISADNIHLEKY